MSRKFALKRYADQGCLRRVRFGLLMDLLGRHQPFFVRRGLDLVAAVDSFDYDSLAAILRAPGRDTPDELIDALFLLDDLCEPKHSDRLADLAKTLGVDLPEDFTPEDAATAIYLADPEALRKLQCSTVARAPRTFGFFAPGLPLDAPVALEDEFLLAKIKRELDQWLDKYGKGRGNVSIQTTVEGPTCLVTIRHGGHYRRGNKIDAGEISTFAFRPPEYDVLLIDLPAGVIGLNLANKSKRQMEKFLQVFGDNLLGPGNGYAPAIRYSFAPLWRDGADSMRCDDIPGMEWVRATEWSWHRVGVKLVRTHNAGTDLFEEMEAGNVVAITPATQFVMVKFEIKFANHPKPRVVVLRGTNTAEYTRDEDAPVVEEWLLRRGFRLPLAVKGQTNVA
jgi:hypothetical protein